MCIVTNRRRIRLFAVLNAHDRRRLGWSGDGVVFGSRRFGFGTRGGCDGVLGLRFGTRRGCRRGFGVRGRRGEGEPYGIAYRVKVNAKADASVIQYIISISEECVDAQTPLNATALYGGLSGVTLNIRPYL